jgi:hypothetical protein
MRGSAVNGGSQWCVGAESRAVAVQRLLAGISLLLLESLIGAGMMNFEYRPGISQLSLLRA